MSEQHIEKPLLSNREIRIAVACGALAVIEACVGMGMIKEAVDAGAVTNQDLRDGAVVGVAYGSVIVGAAANFAANLYLSVKKQTN